MELALLNRSIHAAQVKDAHNLFLADTFFALEVYPSRFPPFLLFVSQVLFSAKLLPEFLWNVVRQQIGIPIQKA